MWDVRLLQIGIVHAAGRDLLDVQLCKLLDIAGEHGSIPAQHDRPLDEFGMLRHHGKQLILCQVLAGDMLAVRVFIRAQNFLWFESGLLK
jgi:hypothetical protein